MTDFEINKLVFKKSDLYFKCEEIMKNKLPERESIMWGDGANWHEFDACNNPSHAWPIILDYKIETATAGIPGGKDRVWWAQLTFDEYGDNHYAEDKNPLRAAMIVYLMMGDNDE